jgi:hypothetical protein
MFSKMREERGHEHRGFVAKARPRHLKAAPGFMNGIGVTVLQITLLLLALARSLLYGGPMLSVWLRCLVHVVLALSLAVELSGQGVRAAGMSAKMRNDAGAWAAHMSMVGMVAAGSMTKCSKCDACKNRGCTGDGCMSSGTCSTYCANLAALPVWGAVIAMPVSPIGTSARVQFQMGWAAPPDPYPPRPSILS